MSIAAEIFKHSANDGLNTALHGAAGEFYSYADLHREVVRLIAALHLNRFASGDRVALVCPRGAAGLISFLAVSSCCTCCPIDPKLIDEEIIATLQDLSVCAIVDLTNGDRMARLTDRTGVKLLHDVIRIGHGTFTPYSGDVTKIGGENHDAPALLLQTSGTTSKPKHVALTTGEILAAARAIGQWYKITSDDLCINPMPHHHVHGLISGGLSSLVAGASQHCATSFSVDAFARVYAALQPTWFTGSPAFHLGLLENFGKDNPIPVNPRLRFIRSSSAPFPASALAAFEQLFDAPLLENYGMTETASTVCSNPLPPAIRKLGSVGCPIGAEIRIINEDGLEAAAGNDGEVLLKGPSVITCYASGESGPDHFQDGWLRTGDVGHIDRDGYLFIVGRSKELIKRGGHSVYPLEVDSALLAHPDVVDAISFSLSHPTLGEELVAVIVAQPGKDLKSDHVREFLKTKLSTYKIPALVHVVDCIPKNATGKASRRQMRSSFAALFTPVGLGPETKSEHLLLSLWQEVTACQGLGVTDNVFVAGGDPLRAQQVQQRLHDRGYTMLTSRDMISFPTVRQQASILDAP